MRRARSRGDDSTTADAESLDRRHGRVGRPRGECRVGVVRALGRPGVRRGGVASFLASGGATRGALAAGGGGGGDVVDVRAWERRRLHDATRLALRPRHRAAPIMAERRRASSTHAVKEAKAREHGCGRWSRIRRRTTLKRQRRSTARAKACKAARGTAATRPLALASAAAAAATAIWRCEAPAVIFAGALAA